MIQMRHYTNKVDMWALGCVMFQMITGKQAFNSDFAVIGYISSTAASDDPVSREFETPDQGFRRTRIADAYKSQFLALLVGDLLSLDPGLRPSAKVLSQEIDWALPYYLSKPGIYCQPFRQLIFMQVTHHCCRRFLTWSIGFNFTHPRFLSHYCKTSLPPLSHPTLFGAIQDPGKEWTNGASS